MTSRRADEFSRYIILYNVYALMTKLRYPLRHHRRPRRPYNICIYHICIVYKLYIIYILYICVSFEDTRNVYNPVSEIASQLLLVVNCEQITNPSPSHHALCIAYYYTYNIFSRRRHTHTHVNFISPCFNGKQNASAI